MTAEKTQLFFTVHKWFWTGLKLKGCDKEVYAIIYGYTQTGNGFYGTRAFLADFTGYSIRSVQTSLDKLTTSGLIVKQISLDDGKRAVMYMADMHKAAEARETDDTNVEPATPNPDATPIETQPIIKHPTPEEIIEAGTVNEISFEESNKIIATVENNGVYNRAQQVLSQLEPFYPRNGKWDMDKPRERSQFVTRHWMKIVNYAKNNKKIPLENIEQWFINSVKNYVESKTVSREAQYIKKFSNWVRDEDYALDWNTQSAIKQIVNSTPLTNQEKSSIRTAVSLATQPENYDPFNPYHNVEATPQIEQSTTYNYNVTQDEIEAAWDYAATIE